MYPEFDLLYKNPSKTESSKQLEMSMKSLLLDEVVNGVTVDIILQKKMFSLLSHPEQDIENLIWRKEILDDFRRNASLLHEFELIERLNLKLEDALKIVKTSASSIITTTGGRATTSDRESSIFTVQTLADCILKIQEIYEQYGKTLAKKDLRSELMISMREFVKAQVENPAFAELKAVASELAESLNLNTSFIILTKLDKYIRILDCEMFALTSDPYNYGQDTPVLKDKDKTVISIGFDVDSDQQLQFLAERSMIKLVSFMESITYQMKKPFDKIRDGFYFYDFAAILERTYERLGLPMCIPEFCTEGNRFECKNIYDLWFSLKQYQKNKNERPGDVLVANDAIFGKDCAAYIITGKNNAGKTVFLRAVGIIQLLGQAALPVPCTEAIITPVAGVYAYFTALDVGQGRFEEEVETVSGFLDMIKPNDMLLFNEVYQSTSFDEASIALSEFIAVAALYKARVISVTHLPDMKKHLSMLKEKLGFEGDVVYAKAEEINGESTHRFIIDK